MSEDQGNKDSSGNKGYGGYGSSGYGGYGYGQGYPGYSNYGGGGGNYGGYYYGYGYNYGGGGQGGGGDSTPQRSFKDYLLILRERIWYFVVTFFIVFVGTLLFTYNTTEYFRSQAKIQLKRSAPDVLGDGSIEETYVIGAEDFGTQVEVIRTIEMATAVASRFKDEDRERFIAPFRGTVRFSQDPSMVEILLYNLQVQSIRSTRIIGIAFLHPDAKMAKLAASYYADEYIQYNLRLSIDASMRAVDDLRDRAASQEQHVEQLRKDLVRYRQDANRTSLEHDEDIEKETLFHLNQMVNNAETDFDLMENRWGLTQEYIAEGKNLWELPFISSHDRILPLLSRLSDYEIELSSMRRRYGPKWPDLMQLEKSKEQTQAELDDATQAVVQEVRVSYLESKKNYDLARQRLKAAEEDIKELQNLSIGYDALLNKLTVSESLLSQINHRLEQEKTNINLALPNARIIEQPMEALEPAYPNIALNLGIGAIAGIFLGLGLVFVVAFLDDRIKTAFDIESAVGLPLIGIVPRIKRLNSMEKARAVAANADRRVTESFRAIHSALKINETSRNAKIIVTTSTTPSEGKTFVTTNLALTYAIHGEKTLIVDGDLRMPNVAKSMEIPPTKGIINVFDNDVTLDEAIIPELYPNLDVLTAGGKAKNPTQILNSPRYEQIIHDLRSRYDRIFIDSPPIGAVSDVLTILPHADGIIYVIKFNAVKRKTAKANLRRIVESNTPVFGAILNQISVAVASYYYANYYDKSYQAYYGSNESEEDLVESKRRDPEPDAEAVAALEREKEQSK